MVLINLTGRSVLHRCSSRFLTKSRRGASSTCLFFSSSSSSSSPSSTKGIATPVSWASLALTAAVGGGIVYYYRFEKERLQTQSSKKVSSIGKPALGGPWTLVENQRPVTDASFHGNYALLYFGFTRCPDICPNELVRLGKVIDTLDSKQILPRGQKIQPLFVTVDPSRDTIAQMEHYKKDFHPRLRMLTGTKDQVADIARAYRVYFSKADADDEADDDYLIDHSIVMYLLGPTGEFLDFFTQSAEVNDIVTKISKIVKQEATSP